MENKVIQSYVLLIFKCTFFYNKYAAHNVEKVLGAGAAIFCLPRAVQP